MRASTVALRPVVAGLILAGLAPASWAFNSGSTGADGALTPTVNTEVVLPASGILNYSSINIPAGVTVTFRRNVANTPVVLLVSGNATISGTLDVSGGSAANSGTSGDGVLADDGTPGQGGPGGYSGGRGGRPVGALEIPDRNGGKGLGPGGGGGGLYCSFNNYETSNGGNNYSPMGGGGGGFGTAGAGPGAVDSRCEGYSVSAGATYGSNELLPLIGGSGGGGGRTKGTWFASGGGGGGGALLLAVSGTLTVTNSTGRILANGGNGGDAGSVGCTNFNDYASGGGGGSGGAIRLIATTLAGNGEISANRGTTQSVSCGYNGGQGGMGRIRLEAETVTRTSGTNPASTSGTPGPIFIAGLPSLRITTVAGVNVPNPPTGTADVSLPETTPNPVTVAFATTGIPVGNTVKLSVAPASGAEVTAVSTALTGSTANATATASINLPVGASTLQANITYTVIVAMGDALSRFAGNERVERISVTAGLDGRSTTKLITVSGREFVASPEALRVAALGG